MKIQASQLREDLLNGKQLHLLDVRTPIEYDEAHIAESQLMPLDQLDAEHVNAAVQSAENCIIVCQSGKRAEQAYQKLQAAGCSNLRILDGGQNAWESANFPLIRSGKKRLPLMRQVQLTVGILALSSSILALTINKNFAIIPLILGCGLTLAGSTGWCGLAIFLSKMPWNKTSGCCGKSTSCSV